MARLPLTKGYRQPSPSWPDRPRALHRLFRMTADGQRLSLRALAARTGISMRMLHYIQVGERMPGLEAGLKLAAAMGRSPWWIVEYVKRVKGGEKR